MKENTTSKMGSVCITLERNRRNEANEIDTHFGASGSAWKSAWNIPSVINPMYQVDEMKRTVRKAYADSQKYSTYHILTLPAWEEEYRRELVQLVQQEKAQLLWRWEAGEYGFVEAKASLGEKRTTGAAQWAVEFWIIGKCDKSKIMKTQKEFREWSESNSRSTGNIVRWTVSEEVRCEVCGETHVTANTRMGWWCPTHQVWIPSKRWIDLSNGVAKEKYESTCIGNRGNGVTVEIYTDGGEIEDREGYQWAYWIPEWKVHQTGWAPWCTNSGQIETLAILRATERVWKEEPEALLVIHTDARTALAVTMGRNAPKTLGKLEGKLGNMVLQQIQGKGGLVLIWNKGHQRDTELDTVEDGIQAWERSKKEIRDILNADTQDAWNNRIWKAIRRRWEAGNFVVDKMGRDKAPLDQRVPEHLWIMKEGSMQEITTENIRQIFWDNKFQHTTWVPVWRNLRIKYKSFYNMNLGIAVPNRIKTITSKIICGSLADEAGQVIIG